ncbi:hypothetical protein F9288_05980 [Sphingomonas sp. CL5.1]|uniref:hypothetical protein n=1 Tax=Sphingomonas sp. CL5.1 TaxID=2653203 RepID=UPI001584058C|nr:hypothetical protein [Sphingomonas sp. CL5.1]QKR99250.1 hypothetical protein F9288_05980 [Sphingomonas sp. CL5.1]
MKWISPAQAMDMVYDDPARIGPDDEFGFALLWAGNGKGGKHCTADLARAKLQPRKPTAQEITDAGPNWAITAADYRLLLADGVADVRSARELFESYDAQVMSGQNLLAIVQTLRFSPSMPRHGMMHAAYMYTALCLQPKKLSSLIVQHMPSDSRSDLAPHLHIVTPVLTHHLSGYAAVHPIFEESPADMHRAFQADWLRVREALVKLAA